MKEFGKVAFCSRKELAQGYLLRESETGLILENLTEKGCDVVAEFEGARIDVETLFERYLIEARKYVGSAKIPIYVDLNPWNAAINQC